MRSEQGALMSWEEVTAYGRIDPANARLRSLITDVLDSGGWKLLWVPPSQPYYGMEGAFADPRARRFTKRLVFSSWRVVPTKVSTAPNQTAQERRQRQEKSQAALGGESFRGHPS
jgi:hypothetical protein